MINSAITQQPQDIGAQVRDAVSQARAAQLQAQQQAREAQLQAQQEAREAQQQAREAAQEARQAIEQARREVDRIRIQSRPEVFIPPFPGRQSPVPEEAVIISLAFFAMCAFIAVGFPLARAWGRRMDKRNAAPASADAETRARLERIEQAVDAIAVEVERISEGQRFTTKIMADLRALPQPDPSVALNERDHAAVPLSRAREAR